MKANTLDLAKFYGGLVLTAVVLSLLPWPQLSILALPVALFLLWRGAYALLAGAANWLFGRMFPSIADQLAAGRGKSTVFGIENSRFFGGLSLLLAVAGLLAVIIGASAGVVFVCVFLFLGTLDAAFHSRLGRRNAELVTPPLSSD